MVVIGYLTHYHYIDLCSLVIVEDDYTFILSGLYNGGAAVVVPLISPDCGLTHVNRDGLSVCPA